MGLWPERDLAEAWARRRATVASEPRAVDIVRTQSGPGLIGHPEACSSPVDLHPYVFLKTYIFSLRILNFQWHGRFRKVSFGSGFLVEHLLCARCDPHGFIQQRQALF